MLITAYEIEIIQNILNEKDLVDRIYINFCNPWPKPRHNKKRLTHTKQLEKYKIFLKPGGEIYFKTDDYNLYKATIKYLEETGFKILKQTENLHKEPIWESNIETEHEKMFEEQGITTKAIIAKNYINLPKRYLQNVNIWYNKNRNRRPQKCGCHQGFNKNHISNSMQRCDFAYLLVIIAKTIIKVIAIMVTATSAVKSKIIICNIVCSTISITSLSYM